jgi:hypothetical protein
MQKASTCLAVLVSVLASSCGAPLDNGAVGTAVAGTVVAQITATGQIVVLQTSVAGTVIAQVAAAKPATPTPAAPVEVAPDQSPTATRPRLLTPDFQFEIPAFWQTYGDPEGKYSFRYPDTWQLVGAHDGKFEFRASAFELAFLSIILEEPSPFEGELPVRFLDQVPTTKLEMPFELEKKGRWPGTVDGSYIQGHLTDPSSRIPTQVLVLGATAKGHAVLALVLGMTVDSVERLSFDRLIASMEFGEQPSGALP